MGGAIVARLKLGEQQWGRIEPLFPKTDRSRGGRPPVDRRRVVDGILWILRTGAPWRDLPKEFGAWQTAWRLFDEWNSNGTLDSILQSLQAACVDAGEIDQELWCIDGTVVRAARCAAGGGKKGIQRNPKTTH
jgi:transposase